MEKRELFLCISVFLVVMSGVIVFKNFKNLGKSLYWLLFPNWLSSFFKKIWDKDLENTLRFELFLLLSAVLVGINYLVFRFLI